MTTYTQVYVFNDYETIKSDTRRDLNKDEKHNLEQNMSLRN